MICECGSKKFYGCQEIHSRCIVDEDGYWEEDVDDGMLEHADVFGPYECVECGKEYGEDEFFKHLEED